MLCNNLCGGIEILSADDCLMVIRDDVLILLAVIAVAVEIVIREGFLQKRISGVSFV